MKRITTFLLLCLCLLSCNKANTANPLEGTLWAMESYNSAGKYPVTYYLEFGKNEVKRWNTENSYGGTGTYSVSGSNISFSNFNVKIYESEDYTLQYTSGTFSNTSMTVEYSYKIGSIIDIQRTETYIKKKL